jgi:hypothetical protein
MRWPSDWSRGEAVPHDRTAFQPGSASESLAAARVENSPAPPRKLASCPAEPGVTSRTHGEEVLVRIIGEVGRVVQGVHDCDQAAQRIIRELRGPAEGIGLGEEAGSGIVGLGCGGAEGIGDRRKMAGVRRERRWEYSEATHPRPPAQSDPD